MPHELNVWYPNTWARRPPGMTWADWQPWQRYLLTPEAGERSFAYDIELRVDVAPPGMTDQGDRNLFARLNARRVDAVAKLGDAGNQLALYEARRIAGWSAIAQLEGYAQLWPMFFPDTAVIELVLVVEQIPDEIRASAAIKGLRVWVDDQPTA